MGIQFGNSRGGTNFNSGKFSIYNFIGRIFSANYYYSPGWLVECFNIVWQSAIMISVVCVTLVILTSEVGYHDIAAHSVRWYIHLGSSTDNAIWCVHHLMIKLCHYLFSQLNMGFTWKILPDNGWVGFISPVYGVTRVISRFLTSSKGFEISLFESRLILDGFTHLYFYMCFAKLGHPKPLSSLWSLWFLGSPI